MHSTHLSRQDTLLAEDPSWSYSQVPGAGQKLAPIPPRNEPMLYIPRNNTVDDSNVHDIALYLKNLHTVKVHLPTSPANSESINNDGTATQITSASNTTNADNSESVGKVCIIEVHPGFHMLNSNQRTSFGQNRLFAWIMRPSRCRQWLG